MRYTLPLAILAAVMIVFFALAWGRFTSFRRTQWVLRIVAALPLAVSSMGHFARPALFAGIIPPMFPHRVILVILSGVFELAGAVGLLVPRVTRLASVCLCLLMIAVFPANVYVANQTVGGLHMPGVPVRTAMQAVYMMMLLIAGWGMPTRRRSPK